MVKKIFGRCFIWLILIFMYLPILLLIVYSFTDTAFVGQWTTFSFETYFKLFRDTALLEALKNTVIIALSSAAISTVLGTMGAIGAHFSKRKLRKSIDAVTQIPIANAEIVIAVSLALLFTLFSSWFFKGESILGWATLIIGHVVLGIPFVYISVKPKLEQMDFKLYEAALDLGCTPTRALNKVVIPDIMPGIMSGFLLSITLSLDDYIVTSFTSGSHVDTLSTFIQDKLAKGTPPNSLRALTSFIFILVIVVVVLITLYQDKKKAKHKHSAINEYKDLRRAK